MKSKNKVYQTGTIRSLLNSVYQGDCSVEQLNRYGDFGLGTFSMFDGEMIVYNNVFYHADSAGKIRTVPQNTVVPFATVTHFVQNKSYKILNCQFEDLKTQVLNRVSSKNFIYAIKIEAAFDLIEFRSCNRENNPHAKIINDLPKLQHLHKYRNIKGVLVGFFFPEYFDKINVSGFHLHFLDSSKKLGGHVIDCKINNAEIFVQQCETLEIDLIDNKAFKSAELNAFTDVDSVENHIKK